MPDIGRQILHGCTVYVETKVVGFIETEYMSVAGKLTTEMSIKILDTRF